MWIGRMEGLAKSYCKDLIQMDVLRCACPQGMSFHESLCQGIVFLIANYRLVVTYWNQQEVDGREKSMWNAYGTFLIATLHHCINLLLRDWVSHTIIAYMTRLGNLKCSLDQCHSIFGMCQICPSIILQTVWTVTTPCQCWKAVLKCLNKCR